MTETPARLEPMRLSVVPEYTAGLAVELSASSARLGSGLHVQSAANLAALVRVMNAYYTNLIEGHNTRPRDIERAMSGDLDVAPSMEHCLFILGLRISIVLVILEKKVEWRLIMSIQRNTY